MSPNSRRIVAKFLLISNDETEDVRQSLQGEESELCCDCTAAKKSAFGNYQSEDFCVAITSDCKKMFFHQFSHCHPMLIVQSDPLELPPIIGKTIGCSAHLTAHVNIELPLHIIAILVR